MDIENYSEWVAEMIQNGKAKIEKNVETKIYVQEKGNEDLIEQKTVVADVITITDKAFIVYK